MQATIFLPSPFSKLYAVLVLTAIIVQKYLSPLYPCFMSFSSKRRRRHWKFEKRAVSAKPNLISYNFRATHAYLKETRPVRNHSNNEIESAVYITGFTGILSPFIVSPAIVAYVEFQASKGLHLYSNNEGCSLSKWQYLYGDLRHLKHWFLYWPG